jgi:hypothetical protein
MAGEKVVTPSLTRDEILEIVKAQRGMMWLFVAKLGLDFGAGAVRDLASQPFLAIYWAAYLAVSLAVAYFVFRLAKVVYGGGPAVICAALIFAPCAGSLAVLIINGNSMDRLRKAGVKVGMMGATALQLRELEAVGANTDPTQGPKPGSSEKSTRAYKA